MKKEIAAMTIIMSMLLLPIASFSQDSCIVSLYTDKQSYGPNERIYIYGSLGESCDNNINTDVAFEVVAPNKNKLFVDQKKTDNQRHYSTSFVAPASIASGTYTVVVSTVDTRTIKTFDITAIPDKITIYTDKAEYIKGEKVFINGNVIIGGLPVPGEEVALTIEDKDGNIVFISETTTNMQGQLNEKFRTSASMQVGRYTLYAAYDGIMSKSHFSLYPNVIINEVMFYPVNDDESKEFIELYNPYEDDVNLEGWQIKDSEGGMAILFDDPVLGAGAFAVITADGNDVDVPTGVKVFEAKSVLGGLLNGGQTITLFDGEGIAVDSFTYKSTYGTDRDSSSVIDSNGEGASLERIDPHVLTNYYANWDSSIGSPTPGEHNTVYSGYIYSNTTLVFADMPRYGMAFDEIMINTRVKNNADKYDLVLHNYTMNGAGTGLKYVLMEPLSYADYSHLFYVNNGDYIARAGTKAAGESHEDGFESLVTVFAPVMNGTEVIEKFRVEMLAPAIVPRGNTFQVIPVLSNEYDVDVENINVNLALSQAGGFLMSDAPDRTLAILPHDSLDSSIVYTIEAALDIPVEALGKRTISLYANGTAGGEGTWDATSTTVEIINHSSPIISLDLSFQKKMVKGQTYHVVGAAFNTGTEVAEDIIITIDADGLGIIPHQAIIIDELMPSSFEMFSFDISAEEEGEHNIVLEMKDSKGNSYKLQKSVYVKDISLSIDFGGQEHDYESSGSRRNTTKKEDVAFGIQEDGKEPDGQNTDVLSDDDKNTYDFDDIENIADKKTEDKTDYTKPEAGDTTPTGNIIGYHMVPRLLAAILAVILIAVMALYSKKVKEQVN